MEAFRNYKTYDSYADAILIYSNIHQHMQKVLNICTSEIETMEMVINTNKLKKLQCIKNRERIKIEN